MNKVYSESLQSSWNFDVQHYLITFLVQKLLEGYGVRELMGNPVVYVPKVLKKWVEINFIGKTVKQASFFELFKVIEFLMVLSIYAQL